MRLELKEQKESWLSILQVHTAGGELWPRHFVETEPKWESWLKLAHLHLPHNHHITLTATTTTFQNIS